ncbi:hypothetical protein ACLOJK_022900 [Asimina triloba]
MGLSLPERCGVTDQRLLLLIGAIEDADMSANLHGCGYREPDGLLEREQSVAESEEQAATGDQAPNLGEIGADR